MTRISLLPGLVATAFLATAWLPAHALGPLDAEVGVIWWAHDIDEDDLGDTDADGTGVYGEIWWNNGWGLDGQYIDSDPDAGGFSDTSDLSIDVKRRVISPSDNTFIALGAGWQDSELINGGSAQGLRLTADARIGLGIIYFYGEGAYMPDLGDAGIFRDIEGTEYQVGVSLTPFPFLNLRVGYRVQELEYNGGAQESEGYLLSGAVHF